MMKRCKDFDCSNPANCKCRVKINIPVVCVIGDPGSNKTEQCTKIEEKFNFKHIKVGDLLKNEVQSHSAKGKQLEKFINSGTFAPTEDVLHLLEISVLKWISRKIDGILINNFPINLEQGEEFEKYISPVDIILYFKCADETMHDRILHKATQKSEKPDDIEDIIKMKISQFRENIMEITSIYEKKFVTIDVEKEISEVFQIVQKLIEEVIENKTKYSPP